ncbi:hypothetical protein [Altericroceibacterium endophyticum]|uniref:Uncharacterized protein n=1 Tax=Altericroceibacterium endophyticum TaxID=1808508 RepID=A0A6I4T2K7_9SPHN|nr:hypothetical protein [Altericroceibacterium endophyticum]MXO65464.1 hypothetical protein [Altericroceibacterium endophyticum]
MTDSKMMKAQEERQADLAPETHNDEQDDHRNQAQEVSQEAQSLTPETRSPTESTKGRGETDLLNDASQDVVDRMRDMESSGRIDMDAYRGEPNYDDNVDKYGKAHKPDGLRGDGT